MNLSILCLFATQVYQPPSTIQSQLDALTNASVPSMTITLGRGLYVLDAPLRVPPTRWPNSPVLGLNSGIHIRGDGMASTQLYWPSCGTGLALTNAAGYEAVTIEDLTMIGPWTNNNSTGLLLGMYSSNGCFAGQNNVIRNCALMGWGTGAACTNQWQIVFDNCVIVSNSIEGLRFAACHGVNVQNCRISGGWSTACNIGIGFHSPLNWCFGDNAQIQNCLFGRCTNAIYNEELNLLSLNNHMEDCGYFYTIVSSSVIGAGSHGTTIVGGYTLDGGALNWTNFPSQVLLDPRAADHTHVIGCAFNGASSVPGRPVFNVTNDIPTSAAPTVVGYGVNSVIYTIAQRQTNQPVLYREAVRAKQP